MATSLRFLQGNLNHCAGAQDLFLQSMLEWSIDVAVAAEPYYVPTRNNWAGDTDGMVAITVSASQQGLPFVVKERGSGFVTVTWGEMALIGVYFSPNKNLAELEEFLDELGAAVGRAGSNKILILGDFNAKSTAWGSPRTDVRGEEVEDWMVTSGVVILNRGSTNTCVRQQGGSIVDLSFASPALASCVENWRVVDELETLSDHLYIRFEISSSHVGVAGQPSMNHVVFPRWTLAQLDRDLLVEASIVQCWSSGTQSVEPLGVDAEALRLRDVLTAVCDAAMPRVKRRPPKREVYWWSSEISDLRAECTAARRQYTHYRRRRIRDEARLQQLYATYSASKKALQLSISRAKEAGRESVLQSLNLDPWGRPYRAARGKLQSQGPPLTEAIQPQLLTDVVSALFPDAAEHTPPAMAGGDLQGGEIVTVEASPVTEAEIGVALLKLRGKKTAPGPDGIPGRVLLTAMGELEEQYRRLLDGCLTSGRFPRVWKAGKLVLLRKEGRPADSPSAYRPIVLLDESGKLFERILAARISRHLREVGPDLANCQYGFRWGRSTIDAIQCVRDLSEEATSAGDVLLAVSLDIANAFNSLPFECIREALRFHTVPLYLQKVIGDYLTGREVMYQAQDGSVHRRLMKCGVPQGSVLGPLLWNIGYDWVLRGTLQRGLHLVCYADDTLVTSRGRTFDEAARLATSGVSVVIGCIEALGLRVALSKTEAICFHGPRRAPASGASLQVGEVDVEVKPTLKYLGLVLDSRWNFKEHFRRLAPKLIGTASALGRLLPNTGGPGVTCRRLYTGVVRSMALYGAPIWADALSAQNTAQLHRPQRVMVVRAIRGYRTVSHEAACVLAGSVPWDLDAQVLAEVYHRRAEARRQGVFPSPEEEREWRKTARQDVLRRWCGRLQEPKAGRRTVEAVRPLLKKWVDRRHGSLTYRLVQILTGHGCFGRYLSNIARRETTAACHHCTSDDDTSQHTLEVCPAWAQERALLQQVVGQDLSLQALVKAMLQGEGSWQAVVSFCEQVMSQKEAAERMREDNPSSQPIRRKRTGRRRRAYAHLQPPQ